MNTHAMNKYDSMLAADNTGPADPELDPFRPLREGVEAMGRAITKATESLARVWGDPAGLNDSASMNRTTRRQASSSRFQRASRHGARDARSLERERRGWTA